MHHVWFVQQPMPIVLVESRQVCRTCGPALSLPLHHRQSRPCNRGAARQLERRLSALPLPDHHELRRGLPQRSGAVTRDRGNPFEDVRRFGKGQTEHPPTHLAYLTSEAVSMTDPIQNEIQTCRTHGELDDFANQSTLGEEDPGAAADSVGHPAKAVSLRTLQFRKALSRWENEGGADGHTNPHDAEAGTDSTTVNLTNAELVQMQIRIIALENLVIALFAGAPETVAKLAGQFAECIAPHAGHTPHHLTVRAASQMLHITQRSELFRERCDPLTPGDTG